MILVHLLARALMMALSMGWVILWPLILGFSLSAAVQAVVSHEQMSRLLPDDSPRTIVRASLLGAASSSCSYAAVALARSIFRTGGNFTAAIVFMIASTNLVVELGIVMAIFLGWQFTGAEFVGGPIMIGLVVILLRRFVPPRMVEASLVQASRGLPGRMEGHAAMGDMAVTGHATMWRKLISPQGRTAVSHLFVMDWASIGGDIALGLLVAGALAAWVPDGVWQGLFLSSHPGWSVVWGPIIGPLIAVVSFVCSVGNIPLAAVLWSGGISFGGVISFILADLLIFPIVRIYARYYGWRMAGVLAAVLYVAMVGAGYAVELIFGALRLVPHPSHHLVVEAGISWNYTTILNIVFLLLAAGLLWRFFRTGGLRMLRMMANSDGS